jgi:hypothetical protein
LEPPEPRSGKRSRSACSSRSALPCALAVAPGRGEAERSGALGRKEGTGGGCRSAAEEEEEEDEEEEGEGRDLVRAVANTPASSSGPITMAEEEADAPA